MQRNGIPETRRRARPRTNIPRHQRIKPCDIPRHRIIRPPMVNRSRRSQRLHFTRVSPASANRQLHHLSIAIGARHLNVAPRAVDLPQQVGPAGHAPAIMDRERCPALQRAMHENLVMGGQRNGLSSIGHIRGLPAVDHARGEVADIAQHLPQTSKRVSQRDAEHRCAVSPVTGIDKRGRGLAAPSAATAHKRRRKHLAHIPIRDQLPKKLDLRSHPHLRPNRRDHALLLGKTGQFPRLREPIPQRPFAIHMLTRVQRRGHQFAMMRHLDRNDHQIDLRRIDQRLRILKRVRQPKSFSRILRAGETGVRHTHHNKLLRQRLQSRNMRHRSPMLPRIESNKPDTNLVTHGKTIPGKTKFAHPAPQFPSLNNGSSVPICAICG